MIIILISANSEWRTAVEYLDPATRLQSPFGEYFHSQAGGEPVTFMQGGWGKVSAAASTQYAIDHFHPEAVINLGTCGGLDGQARVGEILLVTETLYYDIHERMGDPQEALRSYTTKLETGDLQPPYPQEVRPARLASADEDIDPEKVPMLINEFKVCAADWESAAIAWTASRNGVKCLILRGVSDIVSPEGGEIYFDDAAGFDERAPAIMRSLIDALPGWIQKIK